MLKCTLASPIGFSAHSYVESFSLVLLLGLTILDINKAIATNTTPIIVKITTGK
jgi:hypothetical protein